MLANAMGPLHPGASFTLFGSVRLEADRQLEISAMALTQITQFARRVTFQVAATVSKDDVPVCPTQILKRHYNLYIHNSSSIVIGEAIFDLPDPQGPLQLILTLEGTYLAEFNEGISIPRVFFGVDQAYVRKNFIIAVIEDVL
jgi:hypothetical protein